MLEHIQVRNHLNVSSVASALIGPVAYKGMLEHILVRNHLNVSSVASALGQSSSLASACSNTYWWRSLMNVSSVASALVSPVT